MPSSSPAPPIPAPPVAALLAWYARHRRRLPWRAEPGETPDPYRVWLSEIMLQQTTVVAVIPYYERFLRRYPTVADLAAAPEGDVMAAWAGLGYYARARNLHACAKAVTALGGFPRDIAALRELPGIGAYTAAAVGAIAFGLPAIPVDGNVERVTARVFAERTPLPAARPRLNAFAQRIGTDPAAIAAPSDTAQALFDLGATICTPTRPTCGLCPWGNECAGRREGIAESLPAKTPKAARPIRYGIAFHLTDAQGRVLLRRRPSKGMLGGMMEIPTTPWRTEPWEEAEAILHAPPGAAWRRVGEVRHVFTHFELRLAVLAAELPRVMTNEGLLCPPEDLAAQALPSLMVKCLSLVSGTVSGTASPASPKKAARLTSPLLV